MMMSETEGPPIDQTKNVQQEKVVPEVDLDLSTTRKAVRKIWSWSAKGVVPAAVGMMVITALCSRKGEEPNPHTPGVITPPAVTTSLPNETSFNTPTVTATAEASPAAFPTPQETDQRPLLQRVEDKIKSIQTTPQEQKALQKRVEQLNAVDPVFTRFDTAYNQNTVEYKGEQVPELYALTDQMYSGIADNWQVMGYESRKAFVEDMIPVVSDMRRFQLIMNQVDRMQSPSAQQLESTLSNLDNFTFPPHAYTQVNSKEGLSYKVLPPQGVSEQDPQFLERAAKVTDLLKTLPFGDITIQFYRSNDPNDPKNIQSQIELTPGLIRVTYGASPKVIMHEIGHYFDPSIRTGVWQFKSEDQIIRALTYLDKAALDPNLDLTIENIGRREFKEGAFDRTQEGPFTLPQYNYQITSEAIEMLFDPEKAGIFNKENQPLFEDIISSPTLDQLANFNQPDQLKYKTFADFLRGERQNGTFAKIIEQNSRWAKLLDEIESRQDFFGNYFFADFENDPTFGGRPVGTYYYYLKTFGKYTLGVEGLVKNNPEIIALIPSEQLSWDAGKMAQLKRDCVSEIDGEAISLDLFKPELLTGIAGNSAYPGYIQIIR